MKDVLDQYESVARSASPSWISEGVTEFYRATYRHQDDHRRRAAGRDRGDHAADHIAVIGPRHERIVNESTRWIPLIILCLIMLAISLVLLRWTANWAGGDERSCTSGGHDGHDSDRSPYVISSPLVADWFTFVHRPTCAGACTEPEALTKLQLDWRLRSGRPTSCGTVSSAALELGVPIEDIAHLVGHASTSGRSRCAKNRKSVLIRYARS